MRHVKRLMLIWAGLFLASFLMALPFGGTSSDVGYGIFAVWIVLTLCASLAAAHSTGFFAVVIVPATIVAAVAGLSLGGYAPYALRIGDLEPSDYGCCDLGTGAEGAWARFVVWVGFGAIVGTAIGAAVWLVEFLFGEARQMIKETGPHGTFRR